MVIGHRYRITFEDSSIYADVPTVAFIGTYNGIETDVRSYIDRFNYLNQTPDAGVDISFLMRICRPLLKFTIENRCKYNITSDTVISIEDVTNPYFCDYKPMLYDISSPVDERVKFAVLDKRVSVHNMIHHSTCTSVLMRSVRFDVVDYCMIEKNKLWYGKKRYELFDKPGLVLISR